VGKKKPPEGRQTWLKGKGKEKASFLVKRRGGGERGGSPLYNFLAGRGGGKGKKGNNIGINI